MLPTEAVIADKSAADANDKTVPASAITDDWMRLDIIHDSIKTVIWNGPMGVFDFEFGKFADGTEAIARKLADLSVKGTVTTIIRMGDSVVSFICSLVLKLGLEFLEEKPLPDLVFLPLDNANNLFRAEDSVFSVIE